MAQYAFGAGNMYVTQLLDASGAAVANPTPYPLMVLQEGTIDETSDLKELYGQNQRAVAVGRGKTKTTVKVKPARIFAGVWNAIYYGTTLNTGLLTAFTDTTGQTIPTTPFQITIAPPSSGTYSADLGVIDSSGNPMQRVASAPATGQYSVNVATGVYTFAAADTGKTVFINFWYSVAASGKKFTVQNLPMGSAPTFRARLTVNYQGKLTNFDFRSCVATKFGIGFKNEDFAVPELDFSLQDDGTGVLYDVSTSE